MNVKKVLSFPFVIVFALVFVIVFVCVGLVTDLIVTPIQQIVIKVKEYLVDKKRILKTINKKDRFGIILTVSCLLFFIVSVAYMLIKA